MTEIPAIQWPTAEDFRAALDDEELPEATLVELGRLTYATVKLEARCNEVLSLVEWSTGVERPGWRPTSQRIREAVAVLETWAPQWSQASAIEWLAGARDALDRRQTVLHGDLVTPVTLPGAEPIPLPPSLSHVNRNSQHVITDLEPTELNSITLMIRAKRAGWQVAYTSIEGALVEMQQSAK